MPPKKQTVSAAKGSMPPDYNHQEMLDKAWDAFFNVDPETNHLLDFESDVGVLNKLDPEKKGIRFFKESTQQMVTLEKRTVPFLITQALKRHPVLVAREDMGIRKLAFEQSCQRLKERYDLKELRVAPPFPDESGLLPLVGESAGELFNDLVRNAGGVPNVAIGGGRTLREMAMWISLPDEEFTISALNYATRIPEENVYDSTYLAMHLHWLCRKSTAKIIGIPPLPTNNVSGAAQWHSNMFHSNSSIRELFEDTLDPDIVFVGTGNFDEKSPSISRVYQHLGVDYRKLKKMGNPVGDINLCFFDRSGRDLTSGMMFKTLDANCPEKKWPPTFFPDHLDCHPFLIGMNIDRLRGLVRNGKTVVLVAGGGGGAKADAIRVCLKTKIVNALVTDAPTMQKLLLPKSRGKEPSSSLRRKRGTA